MSRNQAKAITTVHHGVLKVTLRIEHARIGRPDHDRVFLRSLEQRIALPQPRKRLRGITGKASDTCQLVSRAHEQGVPRSAGRQLCQQVERVTEVLARAGRIVRRVVIETRFEMRTARLYQVSSPLEVIGQRGWRPAASLQLARNEPVQLGDLLGLCRRLEMPTDGLVYEDKAVSDGATKEVP